MVFATMLVQIDRMIWEGEFNAYDMQEELNAKAAGFAEFRFTNATREGVRIADEEWRAMINAASHDKTYSCFFEDPSLLPTPARKFFTNNAGEAAVMRNQILPRYKALAKTVCQ
jgi:hypothetical protein